jgi:hypothetical protein
MLLPRLREIRYPYLSLVLQQMFLRDLARRAFWSGATYSIMFRFLGQLDDWQIGCFSKPGREASGGGERGSLAAETNNSHWVERRMLEAFPSWFSTFPIPV